jgi:hypothetical protein
MSMKKLVYVLRFLWNATRGHRLAPWRSPYLRWRIETFCGVKMSSVGFLEFWGFGWRERANMLRFLLWTAEMERWTRPKPKNP